MWAVENETPYATERSWTRDKHGVHQWIVAIKASYRVHESGKVELADEQPPPLLAAEYLGEDGQSSLRFETDVGPPKGTTDVYVCGHARAPHDRPVPELPISLRFGDVEKNLLVRGENVHLSGPLGMTTTSPRPFVRMPVCYERAFGGFDTASADASKHRLYGRNPVGVGFAVRGAHLENKPGPNIVYPGKEPSATGPAGFGAVAGHWSPRVELAGTYDARWLEDRKPLLPTDYDERFAQCSPVDQRPRGYLAPGSLVQLVHMTPQGVFRFEVPRVRIHCKTQFGARTEEHSAHLASLVLEPDDGMVRVVWQSCLTVRPTQVEALDRTTVSAVGV